jgi:hypothetical protein
VRLAAAAAVALGAALAAGCGGGGNGSLPVGAGKAPADAPAFVSLRTDPSSAQWKRAVKLAARFPALSSQLARLERYEDALGPELDLVWLDFANGGDDVVALTKPRALTRLKTLLRPNGSDYSTLSGGWIAIASDRELIDRYKRRAGGEKLDGDKAFENGFGKLDRGAAVRAWVRGSTAQAALDRSLAIGGAAPRITHDAGDLHSLAAAAKAASDGVGVDAYGLIAPRPNAATFAPSLQDVVPAGAALYVAATRLDRPTRLLLRMVGDSKPGFERQLAQVESVLGITLESDVYPLLHGESALAVYPGPTRVPPILFLQKVGDQAKADSVLRRLAAVAQLSGSARVETVTIAGATAQKLTFKGSAVAVYGGVSDGKLFVSDSGKLVAGFLGGRSPALGDDPRFRDARRAAKMPARVAALAYADLRRGLPYVLELARRSGGRVPSSATANTKPLASSLLYLAGDGDGLRISGFTTIK